MKPFARTMAITGAGLVWNEQWTMLVQGAVQP